MHEAYEAAPILEKLPLHIESVACYSESPLDRWLGGGGAAAASHLPFRFNPVTAPPWLNPMEPTKVQLISLPI